MYDEGPLYVFAKNEDVRAQWIKKLKESECMHVNLRVYDGGYMSYLTGPS